MSAKNRPHAIEFLRGNSPDHRDVFVEDYLQFPEHIMEIDREWIQWAFPIDTVSPHNPHAPLIFDNSGIHRYFRNPSATHVINRRKLVQKYLKSIGIDWSTEYDFPECDSNKFFNVITHPHNHHVERISRVLRHLVITGSAVTSQRILYSIAQQLISKYPSNFSSYTVAYWNAIAYSYLTAFE